VKRNWHRELFCAGISTHSECPALRLAQTPALLKILLRVSSAEDSKLNTDLLASVDVVLVSSYCHSEEQIELALDLLRFLGELIPTMVESELVQLLSSLQACMIRWIVDEDTLLSDDEHRDLVSHGLADIAN